MSKKTVIIVSSVLLAVLAAIAGVLLVLKFTEKAYDESQNPSYSSVLSDSLSNESEIVSTPEETVSEVIPDFEIYSPKKTTVSTTESTILFSGKSNTKDPVTLNGKAITLTADGLFSETVELKEGKNTFTFKHKDKSYVYTVNYRYVILKEYSPSSSQNYKSGSTLAVSAKARKGSVVTAEFNGETITLKEYTAQNEEKNNSKEFVDYIGTFKLPSTTKDTNLGRIVFRATFNGKSERYKSGNIICKKADIPVKYNPNAAPLGGKYLNVGTGKITEIIAYEAETFDAYSTNDWSRPTNNYLPKGTVDYSAQGYVYYQSGSTKKEYAVLRCGRQVYTSRKNIPTNEIIPVVKEYKGTLPDHNEIKIASFKTEGNHTVLTLDTMWKAPFYFDILPQSYTNPKKQDYTVSNVTCSYIDITLCYTTVFEGSISIPKTNPLFSSAKIIKNKSDYTIRLYLRKQGGFYGWDANYNSKGQLVFEFLNPARVSKTTSNTYGADLSGVKILIDVGHGGKDPGALGFSSKYTEASQNLALANKIKAELQKTGATVYLTRTSNVTSSNDDKIKMLKNLKPDYCIAIHHDSANGGSANGFGAYYSHSFSKKATEFVYMHSKNTGLYKNSKISWHYYYMARSSYCPVVLTENGFMSNTYDYSHITSDASLNKKAAAIARGIADYFLSVSPNDVPLPEPPAEPSKPETPSELQTPSTPEEPSQPETPSNPEEPSEPDTPSSPETPSTPESTTQPPNDEEDTEKQNN